jgi:hypothetical protein
MPAWAGEHAVAVHTPIATQSLVSHRVTVLFDSIADLLSGVDFVPVLFH